MALRIPFYTNPFAVAGDLTPIPVTTQVDGSLSYNQGWGPDYQRDQTTDPLAKDIDRRQMNQVLNTVTALLRQYQAEAFPEFIDASDNGAVPFPYEINTIVRWRPTGGSPFANYVSLVANNTAVPSDATKWQPLTLAIASAAQAQAAAVSTALLTPLSLAQAFQKSMTTSGYFRFPGPDPLIIQWGQFTQADTGGAVVFNVTLPVAYPTGGLQALVSAGSDLNLGVVYADVENVTSTNVIAGFTVGAAHSRVYRYISIGH